jgi:hypothetical protein
MTVEACIDTPTTRSSGRHAARCEHAIRGMTARRPADAPSPTIDRAITDTERAAWRCRMAARAVLTRAGDTTVPKLSLLARDETTLSIPAGAGELLTITYRASKVTPRFLEALQKAETDGSIAGSLIRPLSELLVSWDLLTDDEAPIPTTPKALEGVPFPVLVTVMNAIAASLADGGINGSGH